MPTISIEQAIEDIRDGKMVILVDDEDRENEGDLVMAAGLVDADDINFMARYGRGLPANHLPLSVYSVFQTGHDLLAAAFAAGFAHIAVLAPPDKPHDLPALETQAALIEAFVAALRDRTGGKVEIEVAT